jgi:hypothetical protein
VKAIVTQLVTQRTEKATSKDRKWPVPWSGWPDLNRRPLRPELSAQASKTAASRPLPWSQAVLASASPRLTAPGGASLLPFCSQTAVLRWAVGGGPIVAQHIHVQLGPRTADPTRWMIPGRPGGRRESGRLARGRVGKAALVLPTRADETAGLAGMP